MKTWQWCTVVAGLLLFTVIAFTYNTDMFQTIDARASQAIAGNGIITAFHYLGETIFVLVLAAVFIGICIVKKRNDYAVFTFATIIGGYIINQVVKRIFERPRPEIADQLTSFSFPSGHTMASLCWILTAVYVLNALYRQARVHTTVWIGATVLFMLVGMSRVAESRHFFSDVLAGWGLALAWFIFCIIVLQRWQQTKNKQSGHKKRHLV